MSAAADPPRLPPSAPRLSGEYYSACQQVFRSCTDQGPAMLAELERLVAGRRQLSILSVGSGTGLFELPLLERMAERQIRITRFVGMDIDRQACQTLRSRLRQQFGQRLNYRVLHRSFEDHQGRQRFDLVLFVHTFEYLTGDLPGWIERARSLLTPAGLLVIFSPQRGGINALYEQVTHGAFSDDLARLLEARGIPYAAKQIDAQCDVSSLFEGPPPQRIGLLSFLTQLDCRALEPEQQAELAGYFRSLADPRTRAVPHPATAIVIAA